MFPDEMKRLGWHELDVLLVTGDAYVDHPSYGAAVIGRLLESRGYKVGIVAQPDWSKLDDFTRLGRPRLCVCVTAGNVDSMVANYTANKRKRREDDYAPGGVSGKRPDRASIVYANRVRAAFKGDKSRWGNAPLRDIPVILGGVEASMRRLAHYDYWDNAVRRSLLLDAKADLLIYGMGERPIVEVIDRLNQGEAIGAIRDVRGTVVRIKKDAIPAGAVVLPSFEEASASIENFNKAFLLTHKEMNPARGRPVAQMHADQCVLQLPPALPLTTKELDASYELPYQRAWHPSYTAAGGVKGFEMVRWSITALRGCPGECSFCGISMHQGRAVQSRSPESILKEARLIARHPDFKGTISDVGGPTANLYAAHCSNWDKADPCPGKQCLMPQKCRSLELGCGKALSLYDSIRRIPGVKHVFIGSGLRYDLLLEPEAERYFKGLCEHYVSGQMKVAPEHTDNKVLKLMNKPPHERYEEFVRKFEEINSGMKDRKYLVNYFISSHPGAGLDEALACAMTLLSHGMRPEQVQDFLPLPMTVAGAMHHTGIHPLTGERVYVPKDDRERAMQRALVQSQNESNAPLIGKALKVLGKEHLADRFRRTSPLPESRISGREAVKKNPTFRKWGGKRVRSLILAAVVLVTASSAWAGAKHVVLVSFDGLRPDAVSGLTDRELPNFYRLMREGAFTLNARTDVDMTVTLPNHTCMLTGRPVKGSDGHLVAINDYVGKTVQQFKGASVESVFDVIRREGCTSAMDASKDKFELFAKSFPIDEVQITQGDDTRTADQAVKQLGRKVPLAFIFVHFAGMDAVGHHSGWDVTPASDYMKRLRVMDRLLGRLMKAIEALNARGEPAVLVVTADHGGTGHNHGTANDQRNYAIPFMVWGAGVAQGKDLYALNQPGRADPREQQVAYGRPDQPIRNGDAANLSLRLLGLGCVPGSSIGCTPPLAVNVQGKLK
jgi:uncharacterized radical SAM protein YgiQ